MPLPPPPSEPSENSRRSTLPPPPAVDGPSPGPSGDLVCYRHPDRSVGRRCTRCGKPACADCLQQVAVGSHCRDCIKAAQPDLKTRARYWQAGKPAIVATTLIGINIAVFLYLGLRYGVGDLLSFGGGEGQYRFALTPRALEGRTAPLFRAADGSIVSTSGNEWYRLVTSGFVHYGLIHLALNMYFLYVLGNLMEPQLGRWRFGTLYFASLLGGSAGALWLDGGGFTAGASGAVFGLLGAAAIGIWQQGVNPFTTPIGRLLLINLGLTFFIGGISVGGHLGGLIAGSICGYVMMAPGYKGYPGWLRTTLPVAVAIAAVGLSVVLVR